VEEIDYPRPSARRIAAWARAHGEALALAALVSLALVLRFATIGGQSLDHDETVTAARVLGHSFPHAMHVVIGGERSPPLYYVVAWLWSQLLGTGAVALRALSAICGTVTVVAAYLAGRELSGRRAGMLAGILVAANPYLIWYSQEARSYAMLVMFGALGLYFFARARARGDARSLLMWSVASALALCSHYFAVFAILPEAVLLLARLGPVRRVIGAIAGVGAVGLALVPLAVAQEGGGRGNAFTSFSLAQRAATAVVKYATVEGPAPQAGIASTTPGEHQLALVAVLLLVAAVVLVTLRGSRHERRGAATAAAVAAAAFVVPLALAVAGFDFVDPRNLISSLVPALVAVGICFAVARAKPAGRLASVTAVIVFALGLNASATQSSLQRHDWRAAVAAVPRLRSVGLFVVPADGRTPMQYYAGGSLPHFEPAGFRDGIAAKRIVVISDSPNIVSPGPQFTLRSTHHAPQHWTIETFTAPRLVALRPSQVNGTRLIRDEPATGLVPHQFRAAELESLVDARANPAPRARQAT
jgi:mannosyltransferase